MSVAIETLKTIYRLNGAHSIWVSMVLFSVRCATDKQSSNATHLHRNIYNRVVLVILIYDFHTDDNSEHFRHSNSYMEDNSLSSTVTI